MADDIKVTCPACGAVNRFPAKTAGTTEMCERCHAHVDVPSDTDRWLDDSAAEAEPESEPQEASIVLLCPFCDEHAEFDASVAGTTQQCPHCGEELDVLGSLVADRPGPVPVHFRCDWCKRVVQVAHDALTDGCVCPLCGETNEPQDVARNRLTTGQAERLGLLPEPGEEPEP